MFDFVAIVINVISMFNRKLYGIQYLEMKFKTVLFSFIIGVLRGSMGHRTIPRILNKTRSLKTSN